MAVSTNAAGAPRTPAAFLAADPPGQDRPGPRGRHPGIRPHLPGVGADARLDRPVVHAAGTGSAARQDQVRRPRELHEPVHALPAVLAGAPHNLVWLAVFLFIATPIGIFFAVLLDKNIRGTRFYQSAIYMPVVLSLAIVGFIWQLHVRARRRASSTTSWRTFFPDMGNPSAGSVTRTSTSAAVLVAASWRHIGYIMVLYLAGLKSVDPSLRRPPPSTARRSGRRSSGSCSGPAPDQPRRPGHHRHRVAARVRHRVRDQQGPQRPRAAVGAGHQQHPRRGVPGRLRVRDRGRPAGHLARADHPLPVRAPSRSRCMTAVAEDRAVPREVAA